MHRKIVDKIDKDNDGKITREELQDWIKFTRMQHHYEAVNKQWKDLKQREQSIKSRRDFVGNKTVDPNGPISWEMYKRINFGLEPGKWNLHAAFILRVLK